MPINSLCSFCTARQATVEHHLTPRSKGGSKTVQLCAKCHEYAHQIGTSAFKQEYLEKQNDSLYGNGT